MIPGFLLLILSFSGVRGQQLIGLTENQEVKKADQGTRQPAKINCGCRQP